MDQEDFTNNLNAVIDHMTPFDRESQIDYQFWSLNQWDEASQQALHDEGRPALTFDRTRPVIQSVMGSQRTSRFQAQYVPRDASLREIDGPLSESLSKWARYVQQRGNYEQFESLAFQDALITGVGCLEIYIDYEMDQDGLLLCRRVPVREIGWDPSSVDPNMLDAKFLICSRMIDEDEIASRFGADAVEEVIAEATAAGVDRPTLADQSGNTTYTTEQRYAYDLLRPGNAGEGVYNAVSRKVRLHECQYFQRHYETRIMSADVEDPQAIMMEHQASQAEGREPNFPRMDGTFKKGEADGMLADIQQRVDALNMSIVGTPAGPVPSPVDIRDFPVRKYYRSWHTVGKELSVEERPFKNFTYKFITCYEDWSDTTGRRNFFGMMRPMRDPQTYSNKFLSQAVHLFSANPKGLLLYEEDAFRDESQALRDWNKATGAVKLRRGSLTQGREKIKHVTTAVSLRGIETLLAFAQSAVPAAAGVSESYGVGMAQDLRRTSGEALSSLMGSQQRTVATPFDSLRLYRQEMGRLLLDMTDAYVMPEQVERVVGDEGAAVIQLAYANALSPEYDVAVEEVPSSPNEKQEVFNVLMQSGILPQIMQQGVPIPPELADFFPIPPAASAQLKGALEQYFGVSMKTLQLQDIQLSQQLQQAQMQQQMGLPPDGSEPAEPGATPGEQPEGDVQ